MPWTVKAANRETQAQFPKIIGAIDGQFPVRFVAIDGEPLTIVGNIAIGCLVALELVCIVTIARAMYEVFIGWYRNAIGKLVPRGCSGPKLGLKAPEKPGGRGYDSPELFREDSWLRRTGRSRKETAVLEPCIGSLKASAEVVTTMKSVSVHLRAQHAGAKDSN